MSKKKLKQRNFVQMHVQEFCVPSVFEDKKLKAKKGYRKHKKNFSLSEYSEYSSKLLMVA